MKWKPCKITLGPRFYTCQHGWLIQLSNQRRVSTNQGEASSSALDDYPINEESSSSGHGEAWSGEFAL
jgi:hypothetical protein